MEFLIGIGEFILLFAAFPIVLGGPAYIRDLIWKGNAE